MRPAGRRWPAVLLGLVMATVAACGGDDDAAADADSDGDGNGNGFGCPLTAEQVGEILGAAVEKDDATCTYQPAEGLPAAGFMAQLPELCADGFPQANGYTEPVEGLDVDAHLKLGGAATAELWVCGPSSFTVYVDTGDGDTAVATTHVSSLADAALATT